MDNMGCRGNGNWSWVEVCLSHHNPAFHITYHKQMQTGTDLVQLSLISQHNQMVQTMIRGFTVQIHSGPQNRELLLVWYQHVSYTVREVQIAVIRISNVRSV